ARRVDRVKHTGEFCEGRTITGWGATTFFLFLEAGSEFASLPRMSRKPQELDLPRLQRYEALLEALGSPTRPDDLPKLFHELWQRLRQVVEFDFISVMLHDPAEDVMRLHILESEQPMNIGAGPRLPPRNRRAAGCGSRNSRSSSPTTQRNHASP